MAFILCSGALLTSAANSVQSESVYGNKTVQLFDLEPLSAQRENTILVDNAPQFTDTALKISTDNENNFIELRSEKWDQAKCLAFDIYYDAEHSGSFYLRAYAKGQNGENLHANIGLLPRIKTRVTFPLSYLNAQSVFMRRDPARLKGVIFGKRLPIEELDHFAIGAKLTEREPQEVFYISNIALLSEDPDFEVPDVKLVDEMGQSTLRDWPGKTPNIQALKEQLNAALQEARTAPPSTKLSPYGGTFKKRFDASGFFRVEHDGTRWWMVDPDGCGFFSMGLDCVNPGDATYIVPGMDPLFQWLPDTPEFAPSNSRNWRSSPTVNFPIANLIRAFGTQDWKYHWRTITLYRLRSWGFNTIGNWSDLNSMRGQQIPYVLPLNGFPGTKTALFRDFPDVYSDEYKENSVRFAQGLISYKDDPWLIGYFMRNEPEWGFGSFNLASEMLEANPGTATRKALAEYLKGIYTDVEALNKAWETDLKSFNELIEKNFRRMQDRSKKANQDLWDFSGQMVSTYVSIPAAELRKVDPNHLNLGMRYAWISSDLLYKAGENFDVFSINSYEFLPSLESVDEIAKRCNKPTMIGEFHFGALDRGMSSTGLKAVATQKDRGLAYRRYVERGAANPNLLGTHYFILNDQSYLGRFDGENYQIGLVDTAHTPYIDMIEGVIEAHSNVYDIMLGEKKPYDTPVKALKPISF